MTRACWLSDGQWPVIDPLFPRNRPGARRVDDRRVISGVIHVLKSGCPWQLRVIPNNPTRKNLHPFDIAAYRHRNQIERMFSRLNDFRRIATRYDKLARNYVAAVALGAVVIWWI